MEEVLEDFIIKRKGDGKYVIESFNHTSLLEFAEDATIDNEDELYIALYSDDEEDEEVPEGFRILFSNWKGDPVSGYGFYYEIYERISAVKIPSKFYKLSKLAPAGEGKWQTTCPVCGEVNIVTELEDVKTCEHFVACGPISKDSEALNFVAFKC